MPADPAAAPGRFRNLPARTFGAFTTLPAMTLPLALLPLFLATLAADRPVAPGPARVARWSAIALRAACPAS